MKKLILNVIEEKRHIRNLLYNMFKEKIEFREKEYDVKIVYTKEKPKEFKPKTIYLSETLEYGDCTTAGVLFGKIEYNKIADKIDDNDYYVKEFIFYFRTKYLNEHVFAFSEIAITPKCNLACKHCSAAKIEQKELPTLNDYKKFFDDFARQGGLEITFTGGEPTIANELLEECVKYCKAKKISTGIITNGTNLNYNLLKRLKNAGMNYILVSLYGKKHDEFTQINGSFKKSLEGIRRAKKLGFYTMITTVASHSTINNGDFEYLINLAKEENVKLYFNYVTPSGKFADEKAELLTEEDLKKIRKYLRLTLLKKNEKYFYGYTQVCKQASGRIYVSPYGDFCPCPFIQISFGNIKDTSIEQLKNNIARTGYLEYQHNTTCPAAQSSNFINTFLKPIKKDVPTYYKNHPWFKEEEKNVEN